MSYNYITNPITGRSIIIGGDTFNRIVMESHDYIDGRLVRRQTAPPPQERPQYLNTVTGRIVRGGTRTYFRIIEREYEIVDDYYLVHFEETLLIRAIFRESRDRQARGIRRLTFNEIQDMRENLENDIQAQFDRFDDFVLQWDNVQRTPRARTSDLANLREAHAPRLAELNIALCQECLMPVNPSELTDMLCVSSPPNGRSSE